MWASWMNYQEESLLLRRSNSEMWLDRGAHRKSGLNDPPTAGGVARGCSAYLSLGTNLLDLNGISSGDFHIVDTA